MTWLFIHHCVAHPLLFVLHAAERFHDWTGRKAYPEDPSNAP